MTTTKRVASRATTRRGKVRKEFWLDPKALKRAQKLLGVETERETVERAIDLITFRDELLRGVQALGEMEFDSRA